MRLHINIDHVCTLRNARGTHYPSPVFAAQLCEQAGADGITLHLREDRRHIRDEDAFDLRKQITTWMNLELAATSEMLRLAEEIRPDTITLVPERREERTTEGGLDAAQQRDAIIPFVELGKRSGARISLFVAADLVQIRAAHELGVQQVELHTGEYCEAHVSARSSELKRIEVAAAFAAGLGLEVAAGHGLNRHNVGPIARIPEVQELNIGHAVIADAVFMGLGAAVKELRQAMVAARGLGSLG